VTKEEAEDLKTKTKKVRYFSFYFFFSVQQNKISNHYFQL